MFINNKKLQQNDLPKCCLYVVILHIFKISFQILLAHNVDVNIQDESGKTALHICLSNPHRPPSDEQKQLAEKLLKTTDLKLRDQNEYDQYQLGVQTLIICLNVYTIIDINITKRLSVKKKLIEWRLVALSSAHKSWLLDHVFSATVRVDDKGNIEDMRQHEESQRLYFTHFLFSI